MGYKHFNIKNLCPMNYHNKKNTNENNNVNYF